MMYGVNSVSLGFGIFLWLILEVIFVIFTILPDSRLRQQPPLALLSTRFKSWIQAKMEEVSLVNDADDAEEREVCLSPCDCMVPSFARDREYSIRCESDR